MRLFRRNKDKQGGSARKKKDDKKPKIKIKVNRSSGTFVKGVSPKKFQNTKIELNSIINQLEHL